ncbi:MAG: phage/plasmid primase, P4 family [Clostridium sp.]|nr:phage/plasmid primase, P4 family [Clostridium sp.]
MNVNYIENCIGMFSKINISCPKDAVDEITSYMINNQVIVFDQGVPYIRHENYYRCIIEEDILMIILNLVDENERYKLRSSVIKEVYRRIRFEIRLQKDISGNFYKAQKYLNLKNGIFSIDKGILVDDKKDLIFDYKLDFEYISNSNIHQAFTFKKYIETSIGLDGCECLLRSTAYAISSLTKGRVAIVLQGKGQTGKSVWLSFLEHVIDPSLRSNVSFHEMTKQEYLIKLLGKRINLCTDTDSGVLRSEGIFKRITASEKVTARDLFQSAVEFTPTLKIVACTNSELNFQHPDDEIYDRLVIIPFNKTIEKKDPDLVEKLIREKDVILSLACDSLVRLVKEDFDFKMCDDAKLYLQRKREELHPEKSFAEQRLIIDPESELSSLSLWNSFKQWCSDNVVQHMGQKKFLRYIENYDKSVVKTMIGPSNRRINGFKGIRMRTDNDKE